MREVHTRILYPQFTSSDFSLKYDNFVRIFCMFKVGRALQPSVFYIGDCEKMFKKKIPKTDPVSSAKMLLKYGARCDKARLKPVPSVTETS